MNNIKNELVCMIILYFVYGVHHNYALYFVSWFKHSVIHTRDLFYTIKINFCAQLFCMYMLYMDLET